jgi:hypothetical protein
MRRACGDYPSSESRLGTTHVRFAALAAALLCLAVSGGASATLYKWTDANGRVVYSDQPPTGNVKTEIVQGAPPPSNPNAVKDLAAKEVELKKRQTDAADKDKKSEAERVALAKRNEQCVRTQSQIRQLASEQIALIRYNEKGEVVYIDDETRRKERADLENWVKQNCA